ncbi:MAG: hypothetical protein LBS53_14760 [Synergistaceae bacterium]|jgi:hypothetical protein|nr:hypothetical protein [Synergistaceae bacterium]
MAVRYDDETLKIIDVGPNRIKRMEMAAAENPVLDAANEIEAMFWADKNEREQYFAYQRMLMDAYSAEHTHEYLIAEAQKKEEMRALKV